MPVKFGFLAIMILTFVDVIQNAQDFLPILNMVVFMLIIVLLALLSSSSKLVDKVLYPFITIIISDSSPTEAGSKKDTTSNKIGEHSGLADHLFAAAESPRHMSVRNNYALFF